jgi:hypothetical protein
MPKVRNHLTYANVMATLAVFLVIGGGAAYAANTIGSSDIIDDSILSRDVKNGQVGALDLAGNAVRTAKVLDESLTGHDIQDDTIGGADVNESLLDPVPNVAANAVTAPKVLDESLTGHDIQDDTIGGADVNESLLTGVSMASFSSHDPVDFALPGNAIGFTQVISLLDSGGPAGASGGWLNLPFDARVIVNGAVVFTNPGFLAVERDVWCRARIAVAGGNWLEISQLLRGTVPGDGGHLTLPITGAFDTNSPGSYNVQVECDDAEDNLQGFRPIFEKGNLTATAIAH